MSDQEKFDDIFEAEENLLSLDDNEDLDGFEEVIDDEIDSSDDLIQDERTFSSGGYLKEMRKYPLLGAEEEYTLAKKWQQESDPKSAETLVNSHLRLVAKIAAGYRGYGLNMDDLISEGLIGMMQALDKFDPEKGFRLSTYASWWIQASIKEYILRSWSLVRLGTTATQKKLFFGLRRIRNKIQREMREDEKDQRSLVERIAERMGLPVKEVEEMNKRMAGQDLSLNVQRDADDDREWLDWLEDPTQNQESLIVYQDEIKKRKDLLQYALSFLKPREYNIFIQRHLKEPPPTLGELADVYGISRERIRQIEMQAFTKVRSVVVRRAIELRLKV